MAKVDECDCWPDLIDMAISSLRPCPFCNSSGRENRLTPKGQTWIGMGYTAPQYWELRHFCSKPLDDDFVDGQVVFRVRDLDDAVRRWNNLSKEGGE
jgi:hypothetical protein